MALKLKFPPNLIWPTVVLIIALLVLVTKPWQTTTETISVTAQGQAEVTPNVAQITATIESKNPNLDAARKENEAKVADLIAGLKNLGVNEKDIKTRQITGGGTYEILDTSQTQIYPAPPRPKPTNQFSTSLEVTISDLTKADEVIGALTAGGATNLYGPNLTVGNEELDNGKSKAREDAVNEAKKKAEELAKLSGRKLGKAVKIQEQGDYGYPIPILARGEADLVEKASQIQPGQNEITINLAVDFALK